MAGSGCQSGGSQGLDSRKLAISFPGIPRSAEHDSDAPAEEMLDRSSQDDREGALFCGDPSNGNLEYDLVQLGAKIDWIWINLEFAALCGDKRRSQMTSLLVIGLLLLKHKL